MKLQTRKPRFLPVRKMYWLKIKTASGKHVYIAKWAQNWSVEQGKFLPELPCPYGELARMYGYLPANAHDEMQLNGKHPAESLALAYEEAAKLKPLLLPGPLYQPTNTFTDGDGI